ncbi:MAG: DMT family transporter [Endomicrobiales bacterium]|nr:DMT family transporter [Endomicrobiales bacterium]
MDLKIYLKNNTFKGLFLSLTGTFLMSFNFVTAKYGLMGFNVTTFTLLWALSASICSFCIIVLSGNINKIILPQGSIFKIILLGVTSGMTMIFSWKGLYYLDPLFSSFLWRFAPVFTVLMGVIFLKEKLLFKELLCLLVMILGGLFSAVGRWKIVGKGIFFTLLACLISAFPMVLAKMKVKEVPSSVLIFYRAAIASMMMLIWALISGNLSFSAEHRYWLVVFLGALIGPTISFLLLFKSYSYWDLSHSTIVTTLQPIFVFPISFIFLGKLPVTRELLGGFIILTGAFWFIWMHFSELKKSKT